MPFDPLRLLALEREGGADENVVAGLVGVGKRPGHLAAVRQRHNVLDTQPALKKQVVERLDERVAERLLAKLGLLGEGLV